MLIYILNPRWAAEHLVHTSSTITNKEYKYTAPSCLTAQVCHCLVIHSFAIAYLTGSSSDSLPLYLSSYLAHLF